MSLALWHEVMEYSFLCETDSGDQHGPRTTMNSFQPLFRWNPSSNKHQAARPNRRILSARDQRQKRPTDLQVKVLFCFLTENMTALVWRSQGARFLSLYKNPLLIPNEELGKPLKQTTLNLKNGAKQQFLKNDHKKRDSIPCLSVINIYLSSIVQPSYKNKRFPRIFFTNFINLDNQN